MKTHTPAPWRVDHSGNCHIGIIDENERTIAFCALQNENSEEDESNSCLIASAPELLAALEVVLSSTCGNVGDDGYEGCIRIEAKALDRAIAAISKAKGNL
jgi:hypothetical protein